MERLVKVILSIAAVVSVAFLLKEVTLTKFAQLEAVTMSATETAITLKERERQLDCLAINIYKEAGNEPFEGKVAVAQVTMNRVASDQFPNDVCQVVYQKTKGTRVVCQFSWYCDSVQKTRRPNPPTYNESYEVAKKVLLEGFRLKMLDDALFYHATYVNPNWRLDKIGKIGVHIFYKQRTVINVASN
jgi:N-acetylmuramoyl-L-alanine amidase